MLVLPATLPQRVESPLSCLVAGKLSASACIVFGIWRSFNLPASCRVALRLCHWVACVILENARIGQVKGIRIGTVCQAYFPTMCVCARQHYTQVKYNFAPFTRTHTHSLSHIHTRWHSLTKWRRIKNVFKMRSGNCCMWQFLRLIHSREY